jgi:hypothetical protein
MLLRTWLWFALPLGPGLGEHGHQRLPSTREARPIVHSIAIEAGVTASARALVNRARTLVEALEVVAITSLGLGLCLWLCKHSLQLSFLTRASIQSQICSFVVEAPTVFTLNTASNGFPINRCLRLFVVQGSSVGLGGAKHGLFATAAVLCEVGASMEALSTIITRLGPTRHLK